MNWKLLDDEKPPKEGRYLTFCYGRNMHVSLYSTVNAYSDGKTPCFPQNVTHWAEIAVPGESNQQCNTCRIYHERNHSSYAGGKWKDCGHPAYLGTSSCEVCEVPDERQ